MKQNYLKHKTLIAILLIAGTFFTYSQDIHFTFANAQKTTDGSKDYYEVDVMIQSTADFKLGSGLLYFNYNTAAFGINVVANTKLIYTQPAGYILGEVYGFPAYKDFIKNDNTDSRFAVSFQQGISSGTFSGNNVTSTPKKLLHLKIEYTDATKLPLISFETQAIFLDQFYTACGPSTFGFPDCAGFPGTQLLNDTFDDANATLGIKNHDLLVGVKMYPNPTVDYITIDGLQEKTSLEIFDMNGRTVVKQNEYLQGNIATKHLTQGIYLVKMVNTKGVSIQKLIKN